MHPLFVYGTLQDKKIQQAIFGRKVEEKAAKLRGYFIDASQDYFDIVKGCHDDEVQGKLLYLNPKEIFYADQWEDVPLYLKELVVANLEDGSQVEAYVYKKTDPSQEPKRISDLSKLSNSKDTYEGVKRLVESRDDKSPISDGFLIYKIKNFKNIEKYENNPFTNKFKQIFSKSNLKDATITALDFEHLDITGDDRCNMPSVFMIVGKDMLVIGCISMMYEPSRLWKAVIDDKVYIEGKGKLREYFRARGIFIEGKPKFVVFIDKGNSEESLDEVEILDNNIVIRQISNYNPVFLNRMGAELDDIFSI